MNNKHRYPENWNDEIRPAILKRDGYKCRHCNIKHRSYIFIDQNKKRIVVTKVEHDELKTEGLRTYRVYLQVAHLDNDPSNNLDTNLIALCPYCHNLLDRPYKLLLRIAKLACNTLDKPQ